jgi:hypothetical protein
MEFIYIVVENTEAYPEAYATYSLVLEAVKKRNKVQLELGGIIEDINDVEENESGFTKLYIGNNIYINIYKLPVRT